MARRKGASASRPLLGRGSCTLAAALVSATAVGSLTACGSGAATTAAGPSAAGASESTASSAALPSRSGVPSASAPTSPAPSSPTPGDAGVDLSQVVPIPRTPIKVPASWPRVQSELGWSFALPPGWEVLQDGAVKLRRLEETGRVPRRMLSSTVIARQDLDDKLWPPILSLGAVPYGEQDLDRLAADFREPLDAPAGSDDDIFEVRTGADAAPGELAAVSVPVEGGGRAGASVRWVVPRADDPWIFVFALVRDWERDGSAVTRIVASLR